PASGNLALLQVTTLTGVWGLSFLVAAFNALLAWCDAAVTQPPVRRLAILGCAIAVIFLGMLAGPQFVPVPNANHYARAVQLNFPEVEAYPTDWFQAHTADLDDIEHISVAPSEHHPDFLVWPEAPAPFSFEDPQFARRASALAIRFRHPFLAGVIEWKSLDDPSAPNARHIAVPYNIAI